MASATEGCYDIGEPARKQRKLDTTEDQSSDLPTKSQDKHGMSENSQAELLCEFLTSDIICVFARVTDILWIIKYQCSLQAS